LHPSEKHKAKMAVSGHSAMFREKPTELCLSCHKSTQAQFAQSTHHRLKEGVLECSNCHNPHGTANGKQLRADNKEVCVQCHQDKRGPFMYEHGAMLSESGCITCHENHGGAGRNMLKARDPKTLCMTCHSREAIGMHGVSGIQYNNGVPTGGLTSAGDCTRCHSEIHGSNSSPFFHR
jgi:DmsE family decaheme c-type cytochrome